ncbi:EAL domain-containing protein [Hyphococcus sp.]|uniref:EAL domain-containing protein n=1 Tax=Hyphococcus sp. TaxID=2038636 RepID=UPI003CCC3420
MGAQAVRLSNVDIDNALKNKDFEVLFQPIFDLGNGALARVESFVRWRHPNLGLLPPGAFISFFESQGRMSELTRYVLANAIASYTGWRGPFPPGLSVNLALSDLSDDAFASHFVKLLRDHEFPADLITLECPMPPVDMPMEKASEHFKRLSETGARLAIEVRGRANDLLRSLDPFPFDEIKTGGSAILRFARTVRGPGLSAIADLLDVASEANAAITAVGVEDQASLAALRGLGFTAAQGNHLGKVGDLRDFRPHRINEVRELLELEPLSAENIAALFRTEAPSLPTTQSQSKENTPATAQDNEDALIERLNERVAQFDHVEEPDPAEEPKTQADNVEAETEADKKAKAREKAKALILAKRARARAARKTAAIERAKAKAADKAEDVRDEQSALPGASAPRELQERLSAAFKPEIHANPAQEVEDAAPQEDNSTVKPAEKREGTPILFSTDEIAGPQRTVAAETKTPAPGAPQTKIARSDYSGGMSKPVTLSVGASSAYFQPGIRVGAPALPGTPDETIAPAGLNIPTAAQETEQEPALTADAEPPEEDDETDLPQSGNAQLSTVERAMASLAPENSPIQKSSAADNTEHDAEPEHTTNTLIGDLNESDAANATEEPRKRKSFLKRTVVPYPTHFWPKSWKRAWRRRNAAKAERPVEESQSNEQLAAE